MKDEARKNQSFHPSSFILHPFKEEPSVSIPGPLNPSPRLLLGPGPCDVHPRVLSVMTTPLLGHFDPQFLEIMNEVQEMLRQTFQTRNALTFPVSATGMAGMETCMVNVLEPGDKALVCVAGFFGQRMVEVAKRAGATVSVLERPWGEVFDLGPIREALKKERPKVLAIVQAETSTGAWQPVEGLGKLCHEFDALLMVDAVTALGCVPLALDAWEVDAVYSCSQKGLSCPPGLSPVSFGPRAVEALSRRKTKVQSWYLDLSLVQHYWDADRFYHHTAPITMIYALHEGLRLVLEEGLEARWARHVRNHKALKAGLTALGLTYTAAEGHQLPQLNAVRIPAGVDDRAVRKRLLSEFGIEIGGGLGDFKGKAWRVGLMGFNSRPGVVLQFLGALEQCLASQGAKYTPGAGVAAANRVYQG
jgi:alanine-glyoxylate transaminase/serine-glyoxylate transaminase/serine-pyruvate transaminase